MGPEFVGYDMIETTLRAYHAGEGREFLARVAPFIKDMWAPHTAPLAKPYDELSDYDKVGGTPGGCRGRFSLAWHSLGFQNCGAGFVGMS